MPEPNSGFVAVAGGWLHSLGLRSDYSIVAWGSDEFNQCTVPPPASGFISIAAGFYHSLGLKADGSIAAFGQEDRGQCAVPEPNTDFVAVAGDGYHSLGLKADSSIVAWGDNTFGQCDVSDPDTGFVAVAGGGYHSLGLKADGSIVAWGDNEFGQCVVPDPNTGFVAVAAGMRFSLGVKADGSVVAWGIGLASHVATPEPGPDVEVAVDRGHSLLGATLNVGTLGIGGDLTIGISDQFNGRIGFNRLSIQIDASGFGDDGGDEPEGPGGPVPPGSGGGSCPELIHLFTGTSANGEDSSKKLDISLQTVPLLIDWHPGGGGFRLTAGMVINGNKVERSAAPGDTVEVNHTDYAVESMTWTTSTNSFSPYLGIGTGNAVDRASRLHFAWDLSVLFHGKPRMDIEGTALNPSMQSNLELDIEEEEESWEQKMKAFFVWPILTLGLSYTF